MPLRRRAGAGVSTPDPARPPAGPALRGLILPVFLPVVVTEIGNGAATPVIAITTQGFGGSTAIAALMVALLGIGRVLGDIPASILAEKVGDRRSMLIAAAVSFVAYGTCLLSHSLLAYAAGLLVAGIANATFYLARQSFVIETVPSNLRARALSALGGSHRIGLFIGPLIGAGAIELWGTKAAYDVAISANILTVILLLVVRDKEPDAGKAPRSRLVPEHGSGRVLAEHWKLFSTLGFAIIAVGAVRAARQTVVPIWAVHIGLGAAQTSLIFAIASAVDMALFYPAGKVMDLYGRLAIALPAMTILGVTMMLLPLTHGLVMLTVVAMAMSLGNGIGAGIMMTLGADTAPEAGRLRFLGIWRFLGDVGNAAGPLLVSAIASLFTLAAGIVSVGTLGLAASAGLFVLVPRYSPFAYRSRRRVEKPEPSG
ncbi:MAG TPA: MFS transporter [Pseudonocardiaceae bacterium]|jgi:MFS family permease|nr:MFS transporter [Pseudonocardiaceae bacterium]